MVSKYMNKININKYLLFANKTCNYFRIINNIDFIKRNIIEKGWRDLSPHNLFIVIISEASIILFYCYYIQKIYSIK